MNQAKVKDTILLATARLPKLTPFAENLREVSRMRINTAGTAEEALDAARQRNIALAVVDDRIGEITGLELVKRLVETDAFMLTAVLNDDEEEEFHDRSEGLGILTRLPLAPGPDDAQRLYELLRGIAS
jgi:DNA-binding NarL/FixJ family response regulator